MLILWCCWRPLLANATGCCSVMAIVRTVKSSGVDVGVDAGIVVDVVVGLKG
jgi:hypothetical protein